MSQAKQKMQVEQKVPDGFQRKTERENKVRETREKQRVERRESNKLRRAKWAKNAETYHQEYLQSDKTLVDQLRKARSENAFYVPAESKLIIATRIKGINALNPWVRTTLRLLRLRQLHNVALIRVNKATIEMLRKVEPYICYGYPSRTLVRDLVYKRGYAKVNGQRIPIQNNDLIEEHLGKYGISCVEDLVHELVTVGPHFKEANSFLWPFKLRSPKGGFRKKRQSFHNNGEWGNQEELINDLIKRMI